MRKIMTILGLCSVVLLLVSCLPSSQETGKIEYVNTLPDPYENPASQPQEPSITGDVIEDAPRVSITTKNTKVDKLTTLLSKNMAATNYNYVFDADASDPHGYEVSILGDKIKKVYFDTIRLRGDIFYNKVFIDRSSKTVFLICDKPGISCGHQWNRAFPVPYTKEGIYTTPVELLQQVNNPKRVGSELFDSRSAIVIEYTNPDGNQERLSVDTYYGLPLRQVIYDENKRVQARHIFTKLAVGQLQEEDVTLPPQYTIME